MTGAMTGAMPGAKIGAIIAGRIGWAPRLLPPGGDRPIRFLPWVVALMVYVAVLGGVGVIVLHRTLGAAERSLGAALTLQVPADTSGSRLATIMATLRRTQGVKSAHLFEAAETARLLEPWLGPAVPLDELPVPRLIDVRIDPAAPPDLASLRREIQSVLPEARLVDHRSGLDKARAAARVVEILLAGVIGVALLLIAASTIFAVKTALLIRREDIELLHLLGAADAAIAGWFATRYLGLGLLGSGVGAVAAILTIAVLGRGGGLLQLPAPVAADGLADWRLWTALVAGVVAAGLIAMASAQFTVRRWLARMP
jgi:cell division transport system permease protein